MIKIRFLDLIGKYSEDESYNQSCWDELTLHYSSRSRYYHNLDHLTNMLTQLDKVISQVNDLDTLLFAIFYHDIIYKATKKDNEHQSALVFKKRIAKTTFDRVEKCMLQIEATKAHKLSKDHDTNILLDLDLSTLGLSQEHYKKYAQDVRKEYRIYPDFMYRKGRKKVLENLLHADRLFKTPFFIDSFEGQAKKNLQWEINEWK